MDAKMTQFLRTGALRTALSLFALSVLALLFIGILPPARAQDPASEMLAKINALRAQNGLAPLQTNAALAAAAQQHSAYLSNNPFGDAHTEADGSTPQDRAARNGYGGYVSENVVGGTSATIEWGFTWWLNSPVHRNNLLGNFTEVGIGYAEGATGRWFTAVFGKLAPAAPYQPPSQPISNPSLGGGSGGGGTGGDSAPAPTQRPRPTQPPPPTFTPTYTLTPSMTFTSRPTFTPTETGTPPPPTSTAIILELSPQAAFVGVIVTATEMPLVASETPTTPPTAAVSGYSSPAAPYEDERRGKSEPPLIQSTGGGLRDLIPILIFVQILILGGLILGGVRRR